MIRCSNRSFAKIGPTSANIACKCITTPTLAQSCTCDRNQTPITQSICNVGPMIFAIWADTDARSITTGSCCSSLATSLFQYVSSFDFTWSAHLAQSAGAICPKPSSMSSLTAVKYFCSPCFKRINHIFQVSLPERIFHSILQQSKNSSMKNSFMNINYKKIHYEKII